MNFVWVYSREAHPEEMPFRPGFESTDLGWDHRYFQTTTMEERAQRAKWMKQDLEPNAELPMIIDYINSPMGPDNAIKQAYLGAGYYSGFVIDCDATIIDEALWAWYAPGGQWWSLLLTPVEDLEDFLDAYLADPPPCYDPGAVGFGPREQYAAGKAPDGRDRQPTILLVDDDAGQAHEGYFRIPLGNLQTYYEVWDVAENGSPSTDILESYKVVVWLTGDAEQDTLTPTDQDNLSVYLDGGGKLLLSGQNIGQDVGDCAFYRDYLHATLIDPDTGIDRLAGADILSGIEITLAGADGAGNQDSPSEIGLLDEAVGVFSYEQPGPPAWGGLRWEGGYQVAYLAFGLEGIGDRGAAALRFKIMKNVLAWFDALPCAGDINDDGTTDLADLATLLSAYGSCPGDAEYVPDANLVDEPSDPADDCIGLEDLSFLLADYECRP